MHVVLGILNVGLVLKVSVSHSYYHGNGRTDDSVLKGSTIAGWRLTVSLDSDTLHALRTYAL
jgi:hypothetical protein